MDLSFGSCDIVHSRLSQVEEGEQLASCDRQQDCCGRLCGRLCFLSWSTVNFGRGARFRSVMILTGLLDFNVSKCRQGSVVWFRTGFVGLFKLQVTKLGPTFFTIYFTLGGSRKLSVNGVLQWTGLTSPATNSTQWRSRDMTGDVTVTLLQNKTKKYHRILCQK